MNLIPYDSFKLKTRYTKGEIEDILRKNMSRDIHSSEKYFCGKTDASGFCISATVGEKVKFSAFNPIIRGKISSGKDCSKIKAVMEPAAAAKAVIYGWGIVFLAIALFLIPFTLFGSVRLLSFLIVVIIGASGYGIMNWLFWQLGRRAKNKLYKVLNGGRKI